MIPFLLILGALYWVAAPDPVTAGARTASGTAARAAGTGARSHWAAGRGQRQARRTKRRDGWWKAGGVRRAALRAEHAGVWSWGAAKTTAGLTAAAARPVPGAVKAGWTNGRDRHRAKAGNRPVPIAVDPPWWHREQPQEQAGDSPEVQPAEQPQVQDGNSPEVQPPHPSGLSPEQRCQWCDDRAATTKRGKLEVCDPCGGEIDDQVSQAMRDHHVTDLPGIGGNHEPDRYTATTRRLPDGSYRGELFYSGLPEEGDQPLVTVDRPTEAEVRHELADVASGIQDDAAHGVPARIAWVPLGENGEPPSPYAEPLSSAPAPADGPIEQPGTDAYLPRQGDPTRTPIRVEIYRAYLKHGQQQPQTVAGSVRRLDTGASYHRVKDHRERSGDRGWTTFHTFSYRPSMADATAEVRRAVLADLGSMSVPYRIEWFIDGRPSQSLNSAPAPADGSTDGAPAPDTTTPTTEGAAMPNVPTELRTHVAVQDFAQQIDSMSESSDFIVAAEKARTIGKQSRAGGFGGEMDLATDALEETARRFAQSVDALREQAHELAKTSLSVQGS